MFAGMEDTTMADATSGFKVRLDPADEYPHEVEKAQNYNESMYFNMFDPVQQIGGWFRIGNRPNEKYAEMTVCWAADEASAIERAGGHPLLVVGADDNIKVTTLHDLALAEFILTSPA